MTNNRRFLIWTEEKLSTAIVFLLQAGTMERDLVVRFTRTVDSGHFHNLQAQTVMPVSYEMSRHTMNIV